MLNNLDYPHLPNVCVIRPGYSSGSWGSRGLEENQLGKARPRQLHSIFNPEITGRITSHPQREPQPFTLRGCFIVYSTDKNDLAS